MIKYTTLVCPGAGARSRSRNFQYTGSSSGSGSSQKFWLRPAPAPALQPWCWIHKNCTDFWLAVTLHSNSSGKEGCLPPNYPQDRVCTVHVPAAETIEFCCHSLFSSVNQPTAYTNQGVPQTSCLAIC
jgi:hypothetical protein